MRAASTLHRIRVGFVGALALAVAGCATPPAPAPAPAPDPAAVRLHQLLASKDGLTASNASADAAQAAARPEALAKAVAGPKISVAFVGNAPELLKPLAAARGLTLKVLGPQPHLPLFVVVTATTGDAPPTATTVHYR